MGGAGLLIQEEAPLPAETGDDKFCPQKQSDSELVPAKKDARDSHGVSELAQDVADDNAHDGVPLIRFLDLAERQALIEPAAKKMKLCRATPKAFDVGSVMKHVADIVLALAGLGVIRGGKDPSQEERRLQAEAYGHLGFLVQELGPRQLVPKSAIEDLIKDLGLDKPEGQKVKTFNEILEEFQPPAAIQMADAVRVAVEAPTTERSNEDPDPHKYLLSASRFHHGGNGASDQLPREVALPRQNEAEEALPKEQEGGATGSHTDFTQAIQDLLQPRYPPDYPFLAAHSRAFMSAAMPCEMCKVVVREIANVLVCDTCEKAFHLRCLQSYLMTGIPKGDWHCSKCSENSKDKPQAPKYGRVRAGFSFAEGSGMSKKSFAKGHSNIPKTKQAHEGKATMEVIDNVTSSAMQKLDDQAPDSSTASEKVINHGNLGGGFTALLDSVAYGEGQPGSKSVNADQVGNHEPSSQSQVQTTTRSVFLRSQAGLAPTMVSSKPQSQALKGGRGAPKGGQKDTRSKKPLDSLSGIASQVDTGRAGNEEMVLNSADNSQSLDEPLAGRGEETDGDKLVKETDRFGIEWVGDIVHMAEGKIFYSACTVAGYLYRLQDCALFRPETPNVPPYIARLQALWEDTSSGAKWVRVNWCYYPADMAMLPGRPSNPEVHEVYESNHGDNNLVGTIQGQCLVLQPESYSNEMERRQGLLQGGSTGEGLVPVFLCRWLYDVATATFRPTSGAP